MPFAEFQPGNAGLALPQHVLAAQDQSMSLMQRAQSMRVQQAQLEMEKDHLASTLAVNAQQVEASRASVAKMQVEQEGQQFDNNMKREQSELVVRSLRNAQQVFFGTPDASTPGTQNAFGSFKQDIDQLYNLPTETPQQLAEFKAKLSYVNSRYGSLAEVHPAAKLMFDQALAPVNAKIAGASGMMMAQSAQQARLLRTKLATEVITPDDLRSFLSANKDNHDFAMLDQEYQKLFELRTKDVLDKAQSFENEKKMKQVTLENEQQLLKQKSTVDAEGFAGAAPTPEAAQKVRDSIAAYVPTRDALDKLEGILKDVEGNPAKRIDRDTTAKAQIFQQQLISAIGRMQTGGVLSDAEAAVMKGLVPDPTKMLSLDSANKAKLESLRHEMEVRMDAIATSNGVKRTKSAPLYVARSPEELALFAAERQRRGTR